MYAQPKWDKGENKQQHFSKFRLKIICKHFKSEKWMSLSRVQLFATPWTIQSMEFSRPEYWNGYPLPSPGDLPNPGIKPRSPALQVDSLPAEPQGKPKNTGVGSLSLLQWIFLIRNRTGVSCLAGRFFTNWAIREANAGNTKDVGSIPGSRRSPGGECGNPL